MLLRPPTDRPPSLRTAKGADADVESGVTRSLSFSGTFIDSTMLPTAASAGTTLVALLCLLALAATAGAWSVASSVARAEQTALGVRADLFEMKSSLAALSTALKDQEQEVKASLSALSAALKDQERVHTQRADSLKAATLKAQEQGGLQMLRVEELKASHAELTKSLPTSLADSLAPKLEKLEGALKAEPSLESSITAPLGKILMRLSSLEAAIATTSARASSTSATGTTKAAASPPPPAPLPLSRPEAHPQSARGDGSVRVIFRFEPVAHGDYAAASAADLYWLGKRTDGGGKEVRYTQIPSGMRVVETTRPGECWLARDPKNKRSLQIATSLLSKPTPLERYCATIAPEQEVIIS